MPRLHEEPTFCDTPIEALGLSKDLGEKLRSAGISAVDDLGPSSSFRLAEILGPKMAHAVLAKTEALKILLLMDPARADERFPARGNDSAAEAAYTQQTRTEHGSRSVVDLSSLDLSVRAHNALKRAGIDTLETLVGMNEDEILSIRNVGRKTLAEILEVIRRCSAVVHGEAEIDEPTASRVKLVKDLDLPFRVWKVLAQAHVVTLKHLTAFSQERMLDQLPVRWFGLDWR
jgi:DNA-directed RNA polymerase alpha subunit